MENRVLKKTKVDLQKEKVMKILIVVLNILNKLP